jgi:hypothetical protein
MAALTSDSIADLVKGTLRDLGRMKFQQIAQTIQYHEIFNQWFKKDKVTFDSGYGIQRTLMTRLSNPARHRGLTDSDTINIPDLIQTMNVPWVYATTSWAFLYEELLQNRGDALIFNIVEPRRADAMISLADEIENKGWSAPSSSTDTTVPYGLTYWVVQASGTPSHQGGAPSGHTTVAGVDLTSVPTFKNWTGQYVAVTKADLVKKLRTAHRKCGFRTPINLKQYASEMGTRYRHYVNETTLSSIEDLGEAQNENLGRDIASMDGTMIFRGNAIIWIPKLDEQTNNPWYGIDHGTFYPCVLKGDFLRETGPIRVADNHNAFSVHVDLAYQYLCVDRRRNWVLYV